MANETTLTIIGYLGSDPKLRFTQGGDAVVNFSVASTPSLYDAQTSQWVDGKTIWMDCVAWRGKAEVIAGAFAKGSHVFVFGKIKPSEWTTEAGEKRSKLELEVVETGLTLRAPAGSGKTQQRGQAQQSRPQTQQADPWSTAPATSTDEPPF